MTPQWREPEGSITGGDRKWEQATWHAKLIDSQGWEHTPRRETSTHLRDPNTYYHKPLHHPSDGQAFSSMWALDRDMPQTVTADRPKWTKQVGQKQPGPPAQAEITRRPEASPESFFSQMNSKTTFCRSLPGPTSMSHRTTKPQASVAERWNKAPHNVPLTNSAP